MTAQANEVKRMNYSDFLSFKQMLVPWLQQHLAQQQQLKVVFISYGNPQRRCRVWSSVSDQDSSSIKRALSFLDKLFDKHKTDMHYLKVDVAYNLEPIHWPLLQQIVATQQHNNHFRKGISLDDTFNICFLEQEIYANAIIKGITYDQANFFDEKNLNAAIKKKYSQLKPAISLNDLSQVWLFDTWSVFYEKGELLELTSTGCENGTRVLTHNKKEALKHLIVKNAEFLHRQIMPDGRFIYGYFPAFDREIKSYNTVRHCTAIYSLLETLEVDYNQSYLPAIKQAIQYAITHFFKAISTDKAFMLDNSGLQSEIKLGSNAAAIFMLAKYQNLTQDTHYQVYAEKLAAGIQFMIDEYGETTHVLSYPELEVKEKFRIVYYDGEAALGLLRLYQLTKNPELLNTVKLMFDHFINKGYQKYHDHWLSYCCNELTLYCPEEKYFQFGLNNYLQHMSFIKNRKTAYATFLEMMMSAYKMVNRLQQLGYEELYATAQLEKLKKLIELRVEFQRATGFFYPEVAMYMAKPKNILNAFYVRHDRFRTRIDDQEHNLSGFIAYLNYFQTE